MNGSKHIEYGGIERGNSKVSHAMASSESNEIKESDIDSESFVE